MKYILRIMLFFLTASFVIETKIDKISTVRQYNAPNSATGIPANSEYELVKTKSHSFRTLQTTPSPVRCETAKYVESAKPSIESKTKNAPKNQTHEMSKQTRVRKSQKYQQFKLTKPQNDQTSNTSKTTQTSKLTTSQFSENFKTIIKSRHL